LPGASGQLAVPTSSFRLWTGTATDLGVSMGVASCACIHRRCAFGSALSPVIHHARCQRHQDCFRAISRGTNPESPCVATLGSGLDWLRNVKGTLNRTKKPGCSRGMRAGGVPPRKPTIGRFMYVRARYAAPATPRFETPPPLCSKQTVPCGSSEQLQVPGHSIARQTLGIDDGGRTEAATVACCAIPAAMMGCWTLRWHREFWCLPRHTGGCLSGTQLFRVGCPVRSLLRETRLQVNEIPVWYRNWPWSCRSRDCNRHSPL
jgi:hypothetical protein